MARSKATRPLWVIAKQDNGRMEVLTLRPNSLGEALPVFSFEEEAEMFLRLETPGTCWRARETTAGELVSLLYGPCAAVRKVALDPLPTVDGETIMDLAGRGRERLVRNLVGERYPRPLAAEMPVSPDSSIAPGEDGAGERERAEAVRCQILGASGEAEFGEDGNGIPDYVVLDFEPSEAPPWLSEARQNK